MKVYIGLFLSFLLVQLTAQQENAADQGVVFYPAEEGNIGPTTDSDSNEGEGSNEDGDDEDDGELQSDDPNSIAFYLYPSAENQSYLEEIRLGEPDSLYVSSYSPSKTPIILIHGFVNNYTCKFSQRVKNALLDSGLGDKHNVIVVDWGAMSTPKNSTNLGSKPLNDLARNPFYQKAVKNVPKVGKRISEFIDFLMMENYLESPSDVYLIGFSLGAQVAGCAGYEVQQNMSMPMGRITGIDPAGPLYKSNPNLAGKLDPSDADFVDVVHTNKGQSGYDGNIGDVDFYPNGGGPVMGDCVAPGGPVDQYPGNAAGVCAHNRAWVYYIKALDEEVWACKCYATPDYSCKVTCQSKILFGYRTPTDARGMYYLQIQAKE